MANAIATIPAETLRQIAQNLLTKTKEGQVVWVRRQPKASDATTLPLPNEVRRPRTETREISYEVILPHSRIVLTYAVPRAEADFIMFELRNTDSVAVDSLTIDEPDWEELPTEPEDFEVRSDWKLLSALWKEVHKQTTGWETVVKDVQSALAQPGPMGQQPTPTLVDIASKFTNAIKSSVGG
jgi:hypothetical protein